MENVIEGQGIQRRRRKRHGFHRARDNGIYGRRILLGPLDLGKSSMIFVRSCPFRNRRYEREKTMCDNVPPSLDIYFVRNVASEAVSQVKAQFMSEVHRQMDIDFARIPFVADDEARNAIQDKMRQANAELINRMSSVNEADWANIAIGALRRSNSMERLSGHLREMYERAFHDLRFREQVDIAWRGATEFDRNNLDAY